MTIVAGLLVVKAANRWADHHLVAFGLLCNAVGYAMAAYAGHASSDTWLLLAFVALGAGVGTSETISNDVVLASVSSEKAGAASAISETAYEVGAVLGTAVLGSVLNAVYRHRVLLPAGISHSDAQAATDTLGGAVSIANRVGGATGEALRSSAVAAFDSGVVMTSGIATVLMVAAAAMSWTMLQGGSRRTSSSGSCS